MAQLNVVSIREMIDSSFGEADENTINFKNIQTVLYILARQLRILERHVQVKKTKRIRPKATISVTEVKIHAKKKKASRKDSPSSSEEETHDRQAQKRGRVGKKQAPKGGKSVEQEAHKVGKGAAELQERKGGKVGELQQQKAGRGGEQQGQQIGKDGIQQSHKDGTGSEHQGQKSGKGGERQGQEGGTGGEQQRQSSGKGAQQQSQKGDKGRKDHRAEKTKVSGTKSPDTMSATYVSSEKSATRKTSTDLSSTDDTTITTRDRRKKDQKSTVGISGRKSIAKKKSGEDDETEILHEKLFIVSRTTSEAEFDPRYTPASTVATVGQYKDLFMKIRDLQTRFGIKNLIELPDDKAFRDNLYKQFSLTDPMAAVQLSARLADTERKLKKMMPIAIKHASAIPGINIEDTFDDTILKDINWGPPGPSSQTPPPITRDRNAAAFKQPYKRAQGTQGTSKIDSDEDSLEAEVPNFETISVTTTPELGTGQTGETAMALKNKVTYDDIYARLDDVTAEIMKSFQKSIQDSDKVSGDALKLMTQYDSKLTTAAKSMGNGFSTLDLAIEIYADGVNEIDALLSSQMTEYQDSLTQMQYDLETAMDALAEALATPSEDGAAIAELNQHFTCFQLDIDGMIDRQWELKRDEKQYSLDLSDLKKRIAALDESKCSRDEVIEALSVKAGIAALNGMVSMNQFDAVRGDLEKRIASAYDKFNGREIMWQKAIDDLIRELNEKADHRQLIGLEQEIQKYLISMKGALEEMLNIVGKINVNAKGKKLDRTEDCICCGTSAHIESVLSEVEQELLRQSAEGAEAVKAKPEHDTQKVCVPGHPVDHKLDPRSQFCKRYCGSTVESQSKRESEFKMAISGLDPPGPNGMTHRDEDLKMICTPCNVKKISYLPNAKPNHKISAFSNADLVSPPLDAESEAEKRPLFY